MGAHHYQLELLPRTSVNLDPDSDDLWPEQPASALLAELRELLPKDTSWSGVEEFRSAREWGSDLRIWHEDDCSSPVFSVIFRFSPVVDDLTLLEHLLELVSRYGLMVHSKASRRSLEPQFDEILDDLRSSTAFQFLSDPEGAILRGAENVQVPKTE